MKKDRNNTGIDSNQRMSERWSIAYRASREITASLDLEQVYKTIHRAVRGVMPCEAFVINLLSEDQGLMEGNYLVENGKRIRSTPYPANHGLGGHILRTGKSLLLNDLEAIKASGIDFETFGDIENSCALLAVPLKVKKHTIGMLSAQSKQAGVYSIEDQEMLEMLASPAAAAIENARLYEQSRQELAERSRMDSALHRSQEETAHLNRLLLALSKAAEAIVRARTREQVIETLRQQIDLLGYHVTIFELDEISEQLKITFSAYKSNLLNRAEVKTGLTLAEYGFKPPPEGIYARVIERGETVHVADPAKAIAEVLPAALQTMSRTLAIMFRLRECCFAPLVIEGRIKGILGVTGGELSESDSPAVTIFANQTAIAMEKAWLHEQAQEELNSRLLLEINNLQRNQDLLFINELNTSINRGDSLADLVKIISSETSRIFGSHGATLHLIDKKTHKLVMQNLALPPHLVKRLESLLGITIPPIEHDLASKHPYRKVLESGSYQIINDAGEIADFTAGYLTGARIPKKVISRIRKIIPAITKLLDYRSLIILPLVSGNQVVGTLDLGRAEPITTEDAERLELIAGQLSLAILRKQAEETLRTNEEKLRSIFRVAPTGIGVVKDRQLIEINARICEMTGYLEEELTGQSARMLYPSQEEFESVGREKYEQIAEDGTGMVETRWLKKDGSIIDILLASTPIDPQDHSKGVTFTALEITNRKEGERNLREAHDRLLLVLESIPADIYVADLETYKILFMNEHMRTNFGGDLIGTLCYQSFRCQDTPCENCTNRRLIDSQGNTSPGITWEGKNLITGLWYRNFDRAIRWIDGRLVRIEISFDISERKGAEEMLQRCAEELAALQTTVLEITSQQDEGHLLQAIVERSVHLLKGDSGGLYLCDPELQQARCEVSYKLVTDYKGTILKYGQGAAGTVAKTGQPLNVADYRSWSGHAPQFSEDKTIKALISTPMIWKGQVTGVIDVLRTQSDQKFTQEDLDLLTLFADHAAIAYENTRLLQQSRLRLQELESLRQASQALTSSLELNPLLESILEAACKAIPGAEKGSILLKDVDGTLRIHALAGYDNQELLNLPFTPGIGFVWTVFDLQQPMILKDIPANYQIPYGDQFNEVAGILSAICAPLLVNGESIGVISLDNASDIAAFNTSDMQLLVSFASSAAVAIQNARLFDQTKRREQLLAALHEVSLKTSRLLEVEKMGEVVIPIIENLLGWSRGSLWLADNDGVLKMLYHSTRGLTGKKREQELERLRHLIRKPGQGIIGWVALHGKPIRSNNVLEDERYIPGDADIRSELCIPLASGGITFGCLNFESTEADSFTEEDERVLTTLGSEVSGAVERIRLFEQIQRRANELGALAQVSGALRSATTRAEMVKVILDQVMELFGLDDSAIVIYDPATGRNTLEDGRGNWVSGTGTRIDSSDEVSAFLNPEDLPLVSEDMMKDERFSGLRDLMAGEAVAGLPLMVQKQRIGSLWVGRLRERENLPRHPFSQEELRLLGSITNITANAMHRAILHEKTLRHAEQVVAVNEIGHALSETLELDQIYMRLTHALQNLFSDLHSINIHLYHAANRSFTCTSAMEAGEFLDTRTLPVLTLDQTRSENMKEALRTGQPVFANEPTMPVAENSSNPDEFTQASLFIPMLSKDSPIGLIHLRKRTQDPFTMEESNLLTLIANTAAITIENARLFAETGKRLRFLTALHNIDAAISASVDLRVTFSIILENITKELKVDAAALALLNPHTMILEYSASRGFQTRIIEGMRLRLGEGLAGQAAIQRRMLSLLDGGQAGSDLFPEENFQAQYALPLIAKGQVQGILQVFHRAELMLDPDWSNFLYTLAGQAAIAMDNANLFDNLQRSNLELTLAYDATIQGWSQAMEIRDKETPGHSERMLEMTMHLAREMEVKDADLVHLRRGVLLHDIGKMGIPESILHKPGPLTDEEWIVVRSHPVLAHEMLSSIAYLREAIVVPYCHHEKWDGSGYPRGLKGEQIPLSARLFSVVDVFDALTSERTYRAAWSRERARQYLKDQAGIFFDPLVVEAFLKIKT